MNILIVCDYFLDYLGGAQTAIAAQASSLREAGHHVTVMTPRRHRDRRSNQSDAHRDSIYSPVVLPGLDMAVIRNSARTRARLTETLEALAIDVVHVHSEFGLAAAALQAAFDSGLPSVHTVHTFYWRSGLRSPLALAPLLRWLHHSVTGLTAPRLHLAENRVDDAVRGMTLAAALRASTVISPSAHQATDLQAAGVRRVATVANCVAPGAGADSRAVSEVSGPLRVLWIGRCVPEKRIVEFAEAAVTACEIVGSDRLRVTIVGAGPLAAEVRRMAGRAPGVRMIEGVPNSAIPSLLASSHVTALSSFDYDNQPMTVAESISALRGVIYVDPRLSEGLDDSGIFVDDHSVDAMAAALIDLALDPTPVIAASQHAMGARTQFASRAHAAALERVYSGAPPRGEEQDARKLAVRA